MTFLKCWNSGVDSNSFGLITSYKNANSLAASLSFTGCPSTIGILCLSGKLTIRQPASDDLLHNNCESFRIRHVPIIEAKRLLVNVPEQNGTARR
jgi:hypothetical protein